MSRARSRLFVCMGSFIAFQCLFLGLQFQQRERDSPVADSSVTLRNQCQRPWFIAEFVQNSTVSQRQQRILPISFGLPEGRFKRAKNLDSLVKTRDFASIIPGRKSTYIYKTEDSYYDGYSEAYFGITFKKAGWDCMRHYEIIASGTIPYFVDIDHLPPKTMHDFPIDLVKTAMNLPGVPSMSVVKAHIDKGSTDDLFINHQLFDVKQYRKLLKQIVDYSLEHLTWAGKARYMLRMVQSHFPCLKSPKVLLVTVRSCEYLSCVLFGGFYEVLGTERMSSLFGAKTALFRSISKDRNSLYGRGYSYVDAYEFWDEKNIQVVARERVQSGFFDVIIFFNGANAYCQQKEYLDTRQEKLLYDYQQKFNPLTIVVDGNDNVGCHSFFTSDAYPLLYHLHFIREYGDNFHPELKLPHHWSGCDCER